MKNFRIVIFLLLLSAIPAAAQTFNGYSGGMMVHGGYVSGEPVQFISPDGSPERSETMSGVPSGVGGAIKIGIGEHLRVGGEGYVSTLRYGNHGSYSTTGWGGILADFVWSKGRWYWFAGLTIGGGSVRNLTLLSPAPLDFVLEDSSASFRKYGFMAIAPFAGIEYALTEKIRLTAKLDWLINASNPQADFPAGPRIYIGILFCHDSK